jgi:hypothetical protein
MQSTVFRQEKRFSKLEKYICKILNKDISVIEIINPLDFIRRLVG